MFGLKRKLAMLQTHGVWLEQYRREIGELMAADSKRRQEIETLQSRLIVLENSIMRQEEEQYQKDYPEHYHHCSIRGGLYEIKYKEEYGGWKDKNGEVHQYQFCPKCGKELWTN